MPNDESQDKGLGSISPVPDAEGLKASLRKDSAPSASQTAHLTDSLPDDPNPRSPKRRRLSSSLDESDEVDISGAAAAALAKSLDAESSMKSLQNQQSQTDDSKAVSTTTIWRTRLDKLPMLNDLAHQILAFLAKLNHMEIGEMLFGPPSTRGQEYKTLKQQFDQAKQLFLVGSSPFLSPQALAIHEAVQIDMLRKANLAIFMASIFSGEIGLRIMDINFVDVFVPEGGRLLKAQGSIYLELKTHAFMAATRTPSALLNQVMTDLFPGDMEKPLLQKRPGAKGLAPSEQDFLKRLGSRRDILYSVIRTNKLNTLPDTYRWNDFAREVSTYLTKHMEAIATNTKDSADASSQGLSATQLQQEEMENQFSISSPVFQSNLVDAATQEQNTEMVTGSDFTFDNVEDFVAQAARTAAISMGDGVDVSTMPSSSRNKAATFSLNKSQDQPAKTTAASPSAVIASANEEQDGSKPHFQQYDPPSSTKDSNGANQDHHDNEVPHSSQTAPTQVLYERARLVNTNKALALKKMAPPTHRRPWTTEEENALMTGLDQVKGPHWSQILAMYGPGGTINESLKDRNQVQLKDKARNLKLFFLKAGIEVPYYLQAVTGDLKTRAPGQAEKMEREKLLEEKVSLDSTDSTELAELAELENIESAEHIPNTYPAADQLTNQAKEPSPEANATDFDMEAMIASAAATASQEIGASPWTS